ncbi:hypothetical protein VPH35_012437 [Triticum aestivum]
MRTRLGLKSSVTAEPTGTMTMSASGLSFRMISLASLMVSPTTSGDEVFFPPARSSEELIFVALVDNLRSIDQSEIA